MKQLVLYSTIAGNFYAQTEQLKQAVQRARSKVGDDVWKRGFSDRDVTGATNAFLYECMQEGIQPVLLEGELTFVGYVENRDEKGQTYPKLRVGISSLDEELLLSVDMKTDVAQRLIVKLDRCSPGDYMRISAWPTTVERGGRQFVNYAVSVKDGEGKEIAANSEFSAKVKTVTEGVYGTLVAAGITDIKTIATAKATKRIQAFKDLLVVLQSRFSQQFEVA